LGETLLPLAAQALWANIHLHGRSMVDIAKDLKTTKRAAI
jgi:hypothetical protein